MLVHACWFSPITMAWSSPRSAWSRLAGKSMRCFTSPVRSNWAGSPTLALAGIQVAYTMASMSPTSSAPGPETADRARS